MYNHLLQKQRSSCSRFISRFFCVLINMHSVFQGRDSFRETFQVENQGAAYFCDSAARKRQQRNHTFVLSTLNWQFVFSSFKYECCK
jgi:hypothetical protein